MAAAVKILVAGDTCGKFDALFKKVGKVNSSKHGPFAALFCLGRFWAAPGEKAAATDQLKPYLDGEKQVPVPTFFIAGGEDEDRAAVLEGALAEGKELCKNLTFLGRAGVRDVAGLKVAFLSGLYDPVAYTSPADASKYSSAYREGDVAVVKKAAAAGVDLLLTCEWGKGYFHLLGDDQLPKGLNAPKSAGVAPVAELAAAVPCRYHFAAQQQVHFQLPPYKNASSCTRFIAMGSLGGNKKKQKALYACNPVPLSKMDMSALAAVPDGATECPYTKPPPQPKRLREQASAEEAAKRQKLAAQSQQYSAFNDNSGLPDAGGYARWNTAPPAGYVCNRCGGTDHFIHSCPQAGQRRGGGGGGGPGGMGNYGGAPRLPPPGYMCRICGQPGHYIQDCPNKPARGQQQQQQRGGAPHRAAPVNPTNCWFCLGNASVKTHLVVSIGTSMYVTLAKGPLVDDHLLLLPVSHVKSSTALTPDAVAEMKKYQLAVQQMWATKGKVPVFMERFISTRAAQHMNMQVVPVPKALAGQVGPHFEQAARNANIELVKVEPGQDVRSVVGEGNFLSVQLPDGSTLVHRVLPGRNPVLFEFQRKTLADLLGCPERSDWKQCDLSEKEEIAMVEGVKAAYQPYDFIEDSDDSDSD